MVELCLILMMWPLLCCGWELRLCATCVNDHRIIMCNNKMESVRRNAHLVLELHVHYQLPDGSSDRNLFTSALHTQHHSFSRHDD